ncbi:MAG TPA: V-type ATP synthase subunit A [Candidatus Nanopelagicaceae bacterium]|nr:V-type ATP synthase subunit A [Candidatus Nanopelagicaceae bacterium]
MGNVDADRAGTVRLVNGPLIEIEGLQEISMLEVVTVGPQRINSEVVAITGNRATLQAYEYTGGLKPGDQVGATGHGLAGLLGPGLLGQAFDGLLRPLSSVDLWLTPERAGSTEDQTVLSRSWTFIPTVTVGDQVNPGDVLGTVPEAGSIEYRVMVPWGVSGELSWLLPKSDQVHALDVVARVGDTEVTLAEQWPVRRRRPIKERISEAVPLHTGQRVLDLMYPVALGSAAAVPGGFGTGKTMLLQQIAKWSNADVIVYVGCGERGNEMADVLDDLSKLTDERNGGRLIDRTVIIANTSNMPMMAREASIYSGITVAEFYRDMGYNSVVIADSTSRWAEALREFANRNGELPAEEGYPATLASALSAFYERAGRVTTLGGQVGSTTVLGAISPPGGDLTEPVTTDTQRFVRSLWLLDRDLAYSRHYPAISWTGSFARDAEAIGQWHEANGDPGWSQNRARAAALLAEADRLSALAEIIGSGSLPGHQRMVLLGGRLLRDGVLQQNALSNNDAFSSEEKGAALMDFVFEVLDLCQKLVDRGVPATTIEDFDYVPVVRAREEFGPDDAKGIAGRKKEFLKRLGDLK